MFDGASQFTLNTCTLNQVSGTQDSAVTTNNDHRTNCDNKTSHHISNSHNNYLYEEDEMLVDNQHIEQRENPVGFEQNNQENGSVDGANYFSSPLGVGRGYGSALSLMGESMDLRQFPPTTPHNGLAAIESVPIPIYDSTESRLMREERAKTGGPSGRRSPSPLQGLFKAVMGKAGRKQRPVE